MKKILLATLSINLALAASAEARKVQRSWAEDSSVVYNRFMNLQKNVEKLNQNKYIKIKGKETPIVNPVSAFKIVGYRIKFERDFRKVMGKNMDSRFATLAAKQINSTNKSLYTKPRKVIH